MDTRNAIEPFMVDLRSKLREQGVLVAEGQHLRLTQDYLSSSPSTAASVLNGGNTNGRQSWLTEDGRTLKELQEVEVADSDPEPAA